MAETSNHISTRRRRRLPWTVVGVVGLAAAIAGCGGYPSTGADSNGGPDDGDGNQ